MVTAHYTTEPSAESQAEANETSARAPPDEAYNVAIWYPTKIVQVQPAQGDTRIIDSIPYFCMWCMILYVGNCRYMLDIRLSHFKNLESLDPSGRRSDKQISSRGIVT